MVDKTCYSWVQLVKKSEIPSTAKLICFYLATFMNLEHDVAWPSQKRIAHETGLSIPTVIKWLQWLNEAGWLITKKSARAVPTVGGTQLQNEYLIDIPEAVLRGLNDLTPSQKGSKADTQRGLNSSQKGVKQLNPNINININKYQLGQNWANSVGDVLEVGRRLQVNHADFSEFSDFKKAVIEKAIASGVSF